MMKSVYYKNRWDYKEVPRDIPVCTVSRLESNCYSTSWVEKVSLFRKVKILFSSKYVPKIKWN